MKINNKVEKEKNKEEAIIVSMISVLHNAKKEIPPLEDKLQSMSDCLEGVLKELTELDDILGDSFDKSSK